MESSEKLLELLTKKQYKEYNRLLVKLYGVESVINGPERLGGQRVFNVKPDWFEYNEGEKR